MTTCPTCQKLTKGSPRERHIHGFCTCPQRFTVTKGHGRIVNDSETRKVRS